MADSTSFSKLFLFNIFSVFDSVVSSFILFFSLGVSSTFFDFKVVIKDG